MLNGINLDLLLQEIEKIIERRLQGISQQTSKPSEYLTRKEVARLLRVSLPTIHEWTSSGFLISHKIGNRVLFKPEEVEECILDRKVVKKLS
jgi:excisionase family DNA binding protein